MSERKESKLRNPQNVIAIGVTVISLCALIVSVQQTQIMKEERELMREHSRKSVWPRIEWGTAKSHNLIDRSVEKYAIYVTNSGIGPAIITDVRIGYKGTFARNWWDLFRLQEIPDTINTNISNRSFNNKIVKVGETIEILNLNHNPALADAYYQRTKGISIEIYYESIYGEKWKYDGQTTVKLDSFEGIPEEEQFN